MKKLLQKMALIGRCIFVFSVTANFYACGGDGSYSSSSEESESAWPSSSSYSSVVNYDLACPSGFPTPASTDSQSYFCVITVDAYGYFQDNCQDGSDDGLFCSDMWEVFCEDTGEFDSCASVTATDNPCGYITDVVYIDGECVPTYCPSTGEFSENVGACPDSPPSIIPSQPFDASLIMAGAVCSESFIPESDTVDVNLYCKEIVSDDVYSKNHCQNDSEFDDLFCSKIRKQN